LRIRVRIKGYKKAEEVEKKKEIKKERIKK
jgi:hypothetical protein